MLCRQYMSLPSGYLRHPVVYGIRSKEQSSKLFLFVHQNVSMVPAGTSSLLHP
jgi:hypothetical protein